MKPGINFLITHDEVAIMEDSIENKKTNNAHRIRLDIAAYKRMLEQALREQAEFLVLQENYNDKVQAGVDRMVELAVKACQGHIPHLVEEEVKRHVRDRVALLVHGLSISVEVSIGNKEEP